MSLDKLQRIKWRLEELKKEKLSIFDITLAIHEEVGMDSRTVEKFIKLLKFHKFIEQKAEGEFPHGVRIYYQLSDNR